MKESKTTRFEVGMPVIYLDGGNPIKAVVESVHDADLHSGYSIYIGWNNSKGAHLSESFTSEGMQYNQDVAPSLFTLPEYEALKALTDSFVDGTFGGEKEQTDTEQPETTDMLDEQGKPVYFSEGMEVGCIYRGLTGKVISVDKSFFNIMVRWDDSINTNTYSFDGRFSSKHNCTTLYPIEQYNTIQLPKLKSIQVVKPKADVISLPSWFKGGAALENSSVYQFLTSQGFEIEKAFDKIIAKSDLVLRECSFYTCQTINGGISVCFTFGNKFYYTFIPFIQSDEVGITINYSKNGENITEIL